MALDEAGFRVRHPEFKGASSGLVTIKLADAVKRLSVELLGSSYDEAHGWLTAHLLATTPWGMAARIDPKLASTPGETIYSVALKQLQLEAGAGVGTT